MATSKHAAAARQRIVSGARRHFLTHGFRNVTMDDLAQELGMSKKTLYAHFVTKRELLEAVIHDKYRDISAALEPITANSARDVALTLRELLACVRKEVEEIHPAFIRDMRREEPEAFQLVERLRQKVIQKHFGRVFETGQDRKLLRSDIAPRVFIEILIGATQALINPAKLEELDLTLPKAFSAVTSVVLEGAMIRPRSVRSKR
jgi:AcrR family transcriptional regulator